MLNQKPHVSLDIRIRVFLVHSCLRVCVICVGCLYHPCWSFVVKGAPFVVKGAPSPGRVFILQDVNRAEAGSGAGVMLVLLCFCVQ